MNLRPYPRVTPERGLGMICVTNLSACDPTLIASCSVVLDRVLPLLRNLRAMEVASYPNLSSGMTLCRFMQVVTFT
jgi:hypothetical protein